MNKKCNEILNKLEAEGKIKILKDFSFPEPIELKLRLKDMLEDEVDEKYYIDNKKVEQLIKNLNGNICLDNEIIGTCHKRNDLSFATRDRVYNPNKLSPTLTATQYKDPIKIIQIGMLDMKGNEQIRRVYGTDGLSLTLNSMQGGNTQPKILEYPIIGASRGRYNSDGTTSQKLEINNTGTTNTITSVQKDNYVLVKEAYDGDSINLEQPNSKTRRGRVGKQIANTLTTSCNQGVYSNFRIRKLTPKETWRLMGFKDYQFERAAKVCSNTQLYKQAGNSIVVPVLEGIFENLRYILED